MGRPFKIAIAETVNDLRNRLQSATSASSKERLQMLYLLRMGKVDSRQELANLLARDKSTITRWLTKYKSDGLVGLLEVKQAPGKPALITSSVLEKLKERLKQPQGFGSYEEVQRWLEEKHGLKAAYKTVHKTVRYKLQARLKVPRPCSVRKDAEAQEQFKKNCL